MYAHSTLASLSGLPALVVEPGLADRELITSILQSAGLVVAAVDGFRGARARLAAQPPSVLVTEIRLGEHNGLHLAHLARWARQKMIVLVTSRHPDPVLLRDAEALGAVFVEKPIAPDRLLATLQWAVQSERAGEALAANRVLRMQ